MSQVKNLRAMFENKEDTSPPDRGRSSGVSTPSHVGPHGTGSPRPLSKVRSSFVAVEKDGRMGLRRDHSGESSVSRRRMSNDTDIESISTVPDKSAIASPEEGSRPARKLFVGEPIPESPRQPLEPTDVFGGEPVNAGQPEKTAADSIHGNEPDPDHHASGALDEDPRAEPKKEASLDPPAADLDTNTKATASDDPESHSETKLVEQPKVDALAKKPAPRIGASTTKPGPAKNEITKPSKTTKPPPGGLKKSESKSTLKDTGKILTKPNVTSTSKPSSGPRATTTSKPSPGPRAVPPSKPPSGSSAAPSPKPSSVAAVKPSTTATKRPHTLHTKVSHDAGFTKPKPKSPTKPVSLPSTLTAPTASSVSKGNAPRQSLSRQSGNLQNPTGNGRSPSRASASTAGAPAKTVKRQPSTISRPRPSVGPPPKKESMAEPSSKKAHSQVDEGFLARMMRPTQASSSKVAEKAPSTPPRKTGPRSSVPGRNSDTKHEGKAQQKDAEGSPRIKRAQESGQGRSAPASVTATQEPHDSTEGLSEDAGNKQKHEPLKTDDSLLSRAEESPVAVHEEEAKDPIVQMASVESAAEVIQLSEEAGQQQAALDTITVSSVAQESNVDLGAQETTEKGISDDLAQPTAEMPKNQAASSQYEAEVRQPEADADADAEDSTVMEPTPEGTVNDPTKA